MLKCLQEWARSCIHQTLSGCQCVRSRGERIVNWLVRRRVLQTRFNPRYCGTFRTQDDNRDHKVDDEPVLELCQTQWESTSEAEHGVLTDRPHQDSGNKELSCPKHLVNIRRSSMQVWADRRLHTLVTLIYSIGKNSLYLKNWKHKRSFYDLTDGKPETKTCEKNSDS